MNFLERRKVLKGKNTLDMIPKKVYKISDNDGLVTIHIPKFKNKILVKYLVPRLKKPEIKLKLDAFGSQVFREMDGEKKVSDIIISLREVFGEKVEPAEDRLSKFILNLYDGGLITFKEITGVYDG
ncbi:hypothetical protein APF79_07680 [bacterium BRH_c32]|nr:MAG: hypothetical protein APF79_07680 [bacterium BRH_c32]